LDARRAYVEGIGNIADGAAFFDRVVKETEGGFEGLLEKRKL
tara:strand:+ start:707 stop:832 length:126 start_codon:yes stop_codon:yes gene_type:complete